MYASHYKVLGTKWSTIICLVALIFSDENCHVLGYKITEEINHVLGGKGLIISINDEKILQSHQRRKSCWQS